MAQRRERCGKQFKIAAARVALSGETRAVDLASGLGIEDSTLRRRAREREETGESAFPGNGSPKADKDCETVELRKRAGQIERRPWRALSREARSLQRPLRILPDQARAGGRQGPQDEGGGEAGRVQVRQALPQQAEGALLDRLQRPMRSRAGWRLKKLVFPVQGASTTPRASGVAGPRKCLHLPITNQRGVSKKPLHSVRDAEAKNLKHLSLAIAQVIRLNLKLRHIAHVFLHRNEADRDICCLHDGCQHEPEAQIAAE